MQMRVVITCLMNAVCASQSVFYSMLDGKKKKEEDVSNVA